MLQKSSSPVDMRSFYPIIFDRFFFFFPGGFFDVFLVGFLKHTCKTTSPTTSSSGHGCGCVSIVKEASGNCLPNCRCKGFCQKIIQTRSTKCDELTIRNTAKCKYIYIYIVGFYLFTSIFARSTGAGFSPRTVGFHHLPWFLCITFTNCLLHKTQPRDWHVLT